jgi:DUF971 family protein
MRARSNRSTDVRVRWRAGPGAYHQAMPSSTDPARIHADRAAGTLTIDWRDEHHTTYPTTTLRWLCPCAYCRGEAGLPGWLDSAPSLTADQVRLVDIALVGQYAVAPTWGDGHHTGFYTFTTLREMCPCAECTASRLADGRPTLGTAGHASHDPGGSS